MKKRVKAYVFGPLLWGWNSKNNLDAVIAINNKQCIQTILAGCRGLSPELVARQLNCSICGQNYEDCSHTTGELYGDEKCTCLMGDIKPLNVAIVNNPEEPKSRVTDMLVFEDNRRSCTWYGFKTVNDDQRFEHINTAMRHGYITEKMALKFSTYFCNNETGKIKFLGAGKLQ